MQPLRLPMLKTLSSCVQPFQPFTIVSRSKPPAPTTPVPQLLWCSFDLDQGLTRDVNLFSTFTPLTMQNSHADNEADKASPKANLAREFRDNLARQVQLCNRLEALADGLPAELNVQECLYIVQSLVPSLADAHRFEEQKVYPVLGGTVGDIATASMIERLNYEHMGDEDYAEHVADTLRDFLKDRHAANVESMAWMLRGFFEAMRRHLAFEQEHVLPLLEAKLAQ